MKVSLCGVNYYIYPNGIYCDDIDNNIFQGSNTKLGFTPWSSKPSSIAYCDYCGSKLSNKSNCTQCGAPTRRHEKI